MAQGQTGRKESIEGHRFGDETGVGGDSSRFQSHGASDDKKTGPRDWIRRAWGADVV